jgi:hypothetical protein
MISRLSHEEAKEISHHHTQEFLDRSRDERRAELKKEEINEPVKTLGMTSFHTNP